MPGIGAFVVRARWRLFRARMIDASLRPTVGYVQLRSNDPSAGYLGVYRCFGTLEAIQADDTLWITDGKISLAVRMSDEHVYYLAPDLLASGADQSELPDETPTIVPWSKIGSLPEGTRMFVCGPLYVQGGTAFFRSDGATSLTVLIYDGTPESVLERSIWSGRHRNEYWNQVTPGSLAAGSLSLLILASVYIGSPWLRSSAILAVAGSLIPVLPLMPPGVPLFFVYRRWWQHARSLRAERDLMRLPLRYDGSLRGSASDGQQYEHRAVTLEEAQELLSLGARFRSASLPAAQVGDGMVGFGVIDDQGVLTRPADPLAEFLIVQGDPATVAWRCERRARRLERLAVVAFSAGLALNLYLALVVMNWLVR
ncbi:MAG: hypothetical protein EA403_03260 [Spirochaetaceae bacterium]|nr:MAG: hypothetical protein EA403_03260 [Spirochaetaceae bacterium]